jgi:hypothetical protein
MGQVNKLAFVNSKLGAPVLGQDTTRVVYDSVTAAITASGVVRTLRFFDSFANKTSLQCNLQTNKLDSAEAMVIKEIRFIGEQFATLVNGTHTNMNVFVGNQCVIKQFPIDLYQSQVTSPIRITSAQTVSVAARFLTDIVLPPQTSFTVTLDVVGAVATATANVTCELYGYGQLYSAGLNF